MPIIKAISNGSCNIEAGGGAWQKSDMGDDLNLEHAISTGIDSYKMRQNVERSFSHLEKDYAVIFLSVS